MHCNAGNPFWPPSASFLAIQASEKLQQNEDDDDDDGDDGGDDGDDYDGIMVMMAIQASEKLQQNEDDHDGPCSQDAYYTWTYMRKIMMMIGNI